MSKEELAKMLESNLGKYTLRGNDTVEIIHNTLVAAYNQGLEDAARVLCTPF